jgi:pyruvate,water dikinase
MAVKLKGIVACRGINEGIVKKVSSIEDVKKVREENIVVTNDNSPLFSLAFIKSKGIISEKGGMLCHLANISREMGKPCLLGVKNATKILKDGMNVILNCDTGEVIIKDG